MTDQTATAASIDHADEDVELCARTVTRARGSNDPTCLDIEMMLLLGKKLGMENFGRLNIQIARAGSAKRPSELQRLVLAIVRHDGEVQT